MKFTGGLVEVIAVLDHLALDGAELTSGLSFISGTFTLNSGSISHTQVLNAECYWYGGTLGVGADLTLTPGHQLQLAGRHAQWRLQPERRRRCHPQWVRVNGLGRCAD